eukprot:scaffold71241_cov75-Phaeocystis_antarctica.AAC.1
MPSAASGPQQAGEPLSLSLPKFDSPALSPPARLLVHSLRALLPALPAFHRASRCCRGRGTPHPPLAPYSIL